MRRAQECVVNAAGAHLEQVLPWPGLKLLDGADDVGSEGDGVPGRLGERPGGDVLGYRVDLIDVGVAGGDAPVGPEELVRDPPQH